MSQKIITFMLGVACIGLLIISGVLYFLSDRTPPEIRLNDEITFFQEGMDESVLLEGVSAYDDVDGDVTDSLRVEVLPYADNTSAKIVYLASDSSNNTARASIVVTYKATSDGETGTPEEEEDESEETSAETADEDETDDAEEAAEDNSTEEKAQDIDNDDTSELVSDGAPVIRLNKTQVVLPVGGTFNVGTYVDEIVDDKDDSYELFRKIQVGGDYQAGMTNTAGTYDIKVYVIDSDGNQSNVETLTLIVE